MPRSVALVAVDAPKLTRTVLLTWHNDQNHSSAARECLTFIRADSQEHPWRAET